MKLSNHSSARRPSAAAQHSSRIPSHTFFHSGGRAAACVLVAGLLASCASTIHPADYAAHTSNAASSPPAPLEESHTTATAHALHNVHPIGSKMLSGAVPDSAAAFDELRSMGVKTIISVDGATPDVASAASCGMRYVHIPITYAQATREQQLEIARAVRDLPGRIYIHCHHGKHRSPAAAAAAAVTLGEVSPEQGVAFMKMAGTAPTYEGLYACVQNAEPASVEELDAMPHDFPAVSRPLGITAAMVDIDMVWEHIGAIKESRWGVPADHPDLVPVQEAARLADLFRVSMEDPKAKAKSEAFTQRMREADAIATQLETLLAERVPKDSTGTAREEYVQQANALADKLGQACKSCHGLYRDKVW